MKKIFFLLILFSMASASDSSRKGTVSGSGYSSTTYSGATNNRSHTLYKGNVIVIHEGEPIYLTVQLESIVTLGTNRMELVMRLWEFEKLLTTKKVSVKW